LIVVGTSLLSLAISKASGWLTYPAPSPRVLLGASARRATDLKAASLPLRAFFMPLKSTLL
jgi:hypothetical protein